MRHSYDCLIVGDDPAACLIACELQKSGVRAALVSTATNNIGTGYWLIPSGEQAIVWSQLSGALPALQRFVQRKLLLEQPSDQHASLQSVWLIDAEDYAWECRNACRRHGVNVMEEGERDCSATIVLEPRASQHDPTMIWGDYRQVSRELGAQGGTAFCFTSSTAARWWIAPLDEEVTSVGVQLPTAPGDRDQLRDAWEDELVACPSLVARLFDAQLVGSLRCTTSTNEPAPPTLAQYAPCPPPSPLARPWEYLQAAEETARELVLRLRREPVF